MSRTPSITIYLYVCKIICDEEDKTNRLLKNNKIVFQQINSIFRFIFTIFLIVWVVLNNI